jgi:hypothetical protein
MTEHAFLAAMLAVGLVMLAIEAAVLGIVSYRISRILERVEGIGAATFLEARKVLDQSR